MHAMKVCIRSRGKAVLIPDHSTRQWSVSRCWPQVFWLVSLLTIPSNLLQFHLKSYCHAIPSSLLKHQELSHRQQNMNPPPLMHSSPWWLVGSCSKVHELPPQLYFRKAGCNFLRALICSSKQKLFFNVHGSVHHSNILVYKSQQDAQVTEFILSDNCST